MMVLVWWVSFSHHMVHSCGAKPMTQETHRHHLQGIARIAIMFASPFLCGCGGVWVVGEVSRPTGCNKLIADSQCDFVSL